MTDQDLVTAAQAYNQLVAAFNRARQESSGALANNDVFGISYLTFDVGGLRVRVGCTSPRLREQLRRPLAHLEVAAGAASPSFTIDFVDGRACPEVPLVLPGLAQRFSPEQETQEYQAGPFLFTLHGDCVLTICNQSENHTVGLVRDPMHWPVEHYQQAIFITLYQHLVTRGFFLIHASAIGRDGKVVLLSAKSGAGKTTTMLTCVQAGLDFYSDDATLLRRSQQGLIEIVSLLGTMNITDNTLAWFPELSPHTSEAANRTGKRLVMIGDVFPRRMATIGAVRAIVAPEIHSHASAGVVPMRKMDLLSELLPFSLDLHDETAAQEHLDFLIELLERVPCYRLKLGERRTDLPNLLEQILASPG